jgi:DeoR/GlpR family transcriptional regulator of sugar metabolism
MSKQRRHEQILALLGARGECSVEALAEDFGVSTMTVRRDLAELVASGRVQRTHGGAALSSAGIAQFRFVRRNEHCAAEKRAIAQAVAGRVAPGMSVVLDTGTTALEVARELRSVGDLRVLTTSLPIAAELHDAPGLELILLGGVFRRGLPDLTGPLTERNLAEFRVDLAVLGADAVEPEGIFTNDLSVARVTQAMVAAAKAAVLVVDHSKFARRAFAKYADWEQFATVFTDSGLSADTREWLSRIGPELVVVQS